METHGEAGTGADEAAREEAREALRVAEEARSAVSGIPTPTWFFVALGAVVAPLGAVVALLPDSTAGALLLVAVLVAWGAALGTLMHLVARQMRVAVWLSPEEMRPLATILLPSLVGLAAVKAAFDPPWWPAAVTGVTGAAVVVFGLYRRHVAQAGSS
jgi:hypothetical protein